MGSFGLTQQEVADYVFRNLGAPSIAVHTTPDTVQSEIQYVLRTLSRRKPVVKWTTKGATVGKQNYTPDPDKIGFGILHVGIPRIDPIAPLLLSSGPRLDIFGYRYSYPYRNIAELEIDYLYFDMATRVMSSDIDWEFIDGDIWIYPTPQDSFQFSYAYAVPKILANDATQTWATVHPHDEDWVLRGTLARVKSIEGRILRRYSGIPGSTASLNVDGEALTREGDEDWKACVEDLESRCPEIPFNKAGSPTNVPLTFG